MTACMTEPDPPTPAAPLPLDARRRRILFRATHRGTQETDRMIGGYVAPRLAGFSPGELDALEAVMDLPDVDLADWLMGRLPIPPGRHAATLQTIKTAAHVLQQGPGTAGSPAQ